MVLAELGSKLQGALSRLNQTTIVDEEVFTLILKEICAALLESDVHISLVMQLRTAVQAAVKLESTSAGINRRKIIQKAVMDQLVAILTPSKPPYELKRKSKKESNVLLFVGLQGSGKTTTIAKVAHYYSRKGWKVAMVCADTFRAGAFDQLKQNATKLRIPFYGSYTEADPVRIAAEGVKQFKEEGYEVILVDTSGRHKQEADLFEEMQQVSSVVCPDDVTFVMDSTIGQAVSEQAAAFRSAVPVGSVIITKLDGHAKGGGALSAVSATDSPITFYGTGEHFSDLEKFNASSFVSRLLGLGDIRGLMEEVQSSGMLENQEAMMEKFQKGVFTLRDMYDQFKNVMKLGPISKVMGMMPGMSQAFGAMGKETDEQSTKRLKRLMYLMDSMTDGELDGLVALSESRKFRVARGAGCHIEEMDFLLKIHKSFAGVVKGVGKSGLMKGGDKGLGSQMARNPNAVMQQLSKMVDPRMMQQMGGPQNMMKMMKQMQNMDMSDMSSMMKMMGGGAGGGFPPGMM